MQNSSVKCSKFVEIYFALRVFKLFDTKTPKYARGQLPKIAVAGRPIY